MKLKATLDFKESKELKEFTTKWNRLARGLARLQQRELKFVESDIKLALEKDPRPGKNIIPWQGHSYTGSLADSVFSSTTVEGGNIVSKIGYSADHGIYMEPGTKVKDNVFVPYGWSGNPIADLTGKGNRSEGIPNRTESFNDLYDWAYDMVTRRTTGKKLSGKMAERRAKRWATRLKYVIENQGQKGYPIIVPSVELMFGTPGTGTDYLARVSKYIQDQMGLESDLDEVPF